MSKLSGTKIFYFNDQTGTDTKTVFTTMLSTIPKKKKKNETKKERKSTSYR